MNVTSRIEKLLTSKGVAKRNIKPTLARVCGISYAAVSQWFSGKTGSIKHENLRVIAKAFGSSVDWLISGEGEMIAGREDTKNVALSHQKPANLREISLKMVPIISWDAASERARSYTFTPDHSEIMMPSPFKTGNRGFALAVEGDAMRNTNPNEDSYPNNTIIYVDPDLKPKIGSPVLVQQKGKKLPIFRIYTRDGGQDILQPLNGQFPIINLEDGDEILGVICGYYRQPST